MGHPGGWIADERRPEVDSKPAAVTELLVSLAAPARLAAHLRVVHEVAWQLTDRLAAAYPA